MNKLHFADLWNLSLARTTTCWCRDVTCYKECECGIKQGQLEGEIVVWTFNCTFCITMQCEWKIKHKKKILLVKESFAMLHINNPRFSLNILWLFEIFISCTSRVAVPFFINRFIFFNLLHTCSFYQQQKLILWPSTGQSNRVNIFKKKCESRRLRWNRRGEREKKMVKRFMHPHRHCFRLMTK